MNKNSDSIVKVKQAEMIRQACIKAAIGAIQNLDLSKVINKTVS